MGGGWIADLDFVACAREEKRGPGEIGRVRGLNYQRVVGGVCILGRGYTGEADDDQGPFPHDAPERDVIEYQRRLRDTAPVEIADTPIPEIEAVLNDQELDPLIGREAGIINFVDDDGLGLHGLWPDEQRYEQTKYSEREQPLGNHLFPQLSA